MADLPSIAKVVVNLALDREFDYRIPERLRGQLRVGCRVWVPFGRSSRIGYVVGVAEKSTWPDLKELMRIEGEQEQIPENLITLARWIADYYCCAHEQAVRAMLPAVVRHGKVKPRQHLFAWLRPGVDVAAELEKCGARAKKRAAVLQVLARHGGACEAGWLTREADATPAILNTLVKAGIVLTEHRVVDRDPNAGGDIVLPTRPLELTPEQTTALARITATLDRRGPGVILLHGVTGSGKTEVYLQAIARCLEQGREAIVLVPEIALTPQTVERFRSRFGDRISVLHSHLSDGERFDEWTRIRNGRAQIAVGARSALFAPFQKLGLVVVDEEHETTDKQDEAPRYNARDVAVVRGKFEGATVVLGTATPSLESFYNCQLGKYELARLSIRVDHQLMPAMELVDQRAEASQKGGAPLFSRRLMQLIRERLDNGEQTILFLNRRGFATQMVCQKCGFVATCEHCSAAYTYHKQAAHLACHLCGATIRAPEACPQCHDPDIRYTGTGTEKIEAIAAKLFPHAAIARMDSDSMTAKHAHRDTLSACRSGKIQILIGTQMIAKGLHFPKVTLVGIMAADMGLHLPDFRAGERTFQLLVQVAGRAGRGDLPGRVIVQTYTPFHPVLQFALRQDYDAFYREELTTRQALNFPPAAHMAAVHFRATSEMVASAAAEAFVNKIKPLLEPGVELFGPMPPPIAKVRNQYRYQLMIRGGSILRLGQTLRPLVTGATAFRHEDVEIHVDIDPQSLL